MADLRLPRDLGNALVKYLGTRPLAEVYQLFQALMALEDVPEPPPEEKPEE